MRVRRFGPYAVELRREEKVLFPSGGITKGDLVRYYGEVAGDLIPQIRGRPLTLQRFPDGIEEQGFYQKEVPGHFPEWIHRARIRLKKGGAQDQVVVTNAASLAYLASQGTVTPHTWLSREDSLDIPDRMTFDLDPPEGQFGCVIEAALHLERILEEVGLAPFFMTTGSSGGHVWVPLQPEGAFDEVRDFAREVAEHLARSYPDRFTTEVRKESREGRLFLDVGRNAYGQTAVAPYAVRARPGAPVATPLRWEELNEKEVGPRIHTLKSVPRRLREKGDPWRGMGRHAASLRRARERWQNRRASRV